MISRQACSPILSLLSLYLSIALSLYISIYLFHLLYHYCFGFPTSIWKFYFLTLSCTTLCFKLWHVRAWGMHSWLFKLVWNPELMRTEAARCHHVSQCTINPCLFNMRPETITCLYPHSMSIGRQCTSTEAVLSWANPWAISSHLGQA